jgi:Fe-S-cluster containining protein
MSQCLHCGDCCLRMSPFDSPNPCRYLIQKDNFYFCAIYDRRPEECRKHDFPAVLCPIGASKLNINSIPEAIKRLEEGSELLRKM